MGKPTETSKETPRAEVERALTLLVRSARVSAPLRDAVQAVEDEIRRLHREFEKLAARHHERVEQLKAELTRQHVKRFRQIVHTKRWRSEAKELRREMRRLAGDRFDDPAATSTSSEEADHG